MTKEQLTKKVQKLLELGSSPNENEAKLAMQRAQDLIAKYGLSLIHEHKRPESIVEIEYTAPVSKPALKEFLPDIVNVIGKVFSCFIFTRHTKIFVVGFKTNVEITMYSVDCILNQLRQDYRAEYKKYRSLSFSHAFWKGASEALSKKFQEESKVGEGIVLYDKTKAYINQNYPKMGSSFNESDSTGAGFNSGFASGEAANIRKGISRGNLGRMLR